MGNTIIQYAVTGITDKCLDEMLVECHPNLIRSAKIVIITESGKEVEIEIEDINIVHAEDIDDSDEF